MTWLGKCVTSYSRASAGPRENVRFPGDPFWIKIPWGRGMGLI